VQSCKSRARDLDLEHTLDARLPGHHRVQFGRNRAICLVVKAIFAKMFTDRQTDTWTDDGCRAIVLAHAMS